MSNYPGGNDPSYTGGPPPGDYPPRETPYQGGTPTGGPAGAPHYGGEQYAGGPMQQPTQQFGYQGASPYSGGGGSGRRSLDVRSTFKTTEFWIFVVVSLGALIAAAFTDEGPDNQGFGAHDAWRLVTVLAVGYMLSRGLTKFGGHEHDCARHESSQGGRS
jgi:hypothetical protein